MRVRRATARLLGLALALAACADQVRAGDNALSANDWAERFCASFVEVGDDLADMSAQGDLAFVAARAATPDEARGVQRRVRFYGRDLVEALDQLAHNLADTGPPDVADGAAFHGALIESVTTLQTTVRDAVVTVVGLDLAEATPTEMDMLNQSLAGLPTAFTAFQGALDGIPEAPEIEAAYARAGQCEQLTVPAP